MDIKKEAPKGAVRECRDDCYDDTLHDGDYSMFISSDNIKMGCAYNSYH